MRLNGPSKRIFFLEKIRINLMPLTLHHFNLLYYLIFFKNRWLDEQKKLAGVSPESPV